MTHGNFMRQNRVLLLNPEILIQILQQLQNPNQGMDTQEINQIKKINYKKPEKII